MRAVALQIPGAQHVVRIAHHGAILQDFEGRDCPGGEVLVRGLDPRIEDVNVDIFTAIRRPVVCAVQGEGAAVDAVKAPGRDG
jgi:hypothetical protein